MKEVKAYVLIGILVVLISGCEAAANKNVSKKEAAQTYSCMPCGSSCDDKTYTRPGRCSHCNMDLVKTNTIVHGTITPAALCNVDVSSILFLDVRTPAEFNGTAEEKFGAIKNAVNIPVQELEKRIVELEKYKDKEIVVYCSHSHRSPRASYMLTQAGFKKVTNMQGGMSVWMEAVKSKACNEKLYQQQ